MLLPAPVVSHTIQSIDWTGSMDGSTASALLDAAESRFATDGIEHASLRAIMREAGVNPAAVHYHFGSREALAQAVLDRVLEPLQRRRLELLEELVAAGDASEVRGLVVALVYPDLEQAAALQERSEGGHRLIGAIYTRPSAFVSEFVEASFAPVAQRFLPHLRSALPHLGTDELMWRVRWCVFGILGARLCDDDLVLTEPDPDRELRRIVTPLKAALEAPATEEGP